MKQKLTRITSLLLAFIMTFSMLLVPVQAVTFTDVPDGAWYQAAVEYVHEKGWMSGVSETEFAPKVDVTRAMFVLVLARIAEAELDNDVAAFTDTPAGKWYTGAAAWASELGIAAGIGDGMFAPNRSITRQDLCTMLYKFVTVKGYPLTATQTRMFSDETAISAYAREAVSFCAATGLVSGFDDGTFRAKETATRAQTAQILMRLDMLLNGEEAPTDPMPAQSFSDDCGDGSAVNVNAPKGALPEGTVMTATPVTDEAVLAAIRSQIDGELVTAHDITFTKDGEEIEPESEVEVRISAEELLACENPTVYHFDAAGVAESVGAQRVTQNADGEAELSFSAKDFSIYVVADSASTSVKLTVQFKDRNETLLNQQTVRKDRIQNANEGDLLVCDPGVRTMAQGQGFFGWMTLNKAQPEDSELLQIDEINAYIKTNYSEITDNTTVTFYAGVFDVVKILYYNQTGAVIDVQMERLTTGDAKTMTVNMDYTPLHSTHMMVDWVVYDHNKITPSDDRPTYIDDDPLNPLTHYSNGDTVSVSKNAPLELFPYIDAGYWISFVNHEKYNNEKLGFDDPTTAEYRQPIQVREGTKFGEAGLPTESNRPGYNLVCWHTAPMWEADEPNVFDPEAVITEDMTLYAEWEFGEATYTIIFWKEKCDYTAEELNYTTGELYSNVERRYSFVEAETVTKRGDSVIHLKTGDRIRIGDDGYLDIEDIKTDSKDSEWSADNSYFYGDGYDAPYRYGTYAAGTDDFYFEIDEKHSDNYARVRGDGSTILNVRYNRKICPANFYDMEAILNGYINYTWNNCYFGVSGLPSTKFSQVYYDDNDQTKVVNVNDVYCLYFNGRCSYVYPKVLNYSQLASNGDIQLQYLQFINGSLADVPKEFSYTSPYFNYVYHVNADPSSTKYGPYGCTYVTIPANTFSNTGRFNFWVGDSVLYTQQTGAVEMRFGVDDTLPKDRKAYNYCGIRYTAATAITAYYFKQSVDGSTYNLDQYKTLPLTERERNTEATNLSDPFYFFSVDLAQEQRRESPSSTPKTLDSVAKKKLQIQIDRPATDETVDNKSEIEFFWPDPETNTHAYRVMDKVTAKIPDHYNFYYYLNRRKYNLTFMSGSDVVQTVPVYYDADLTGYASVTPLDTFKPASHYIFAGWYEDPTFTEKAEFNTKMPQGGVVFYAKWVPLRYRVVLDFYNGVPEGETIKFPIGLASTYLLNHGEGVKNVTVAVADRKDYVFDGWYLEPECKNQVNLQSMHVTDSLSGVDVNYGSRSEAERRGIDKVTGERYDDTVEGNWDVQRKLTLYAKWTRRVENGNGIEVIYHADEEPDTEKVGAIYCEVDNAVVSFKVYPEGLVYSDHTWVPAYAASTALSDGWRYYRWRLLDQDLQPTGTTFFPGETFLLDAQYAVEEPIYDVVEGVTEAWSQDHEHTFDGINHPGQAPTCTADGWNDISFFASELGGIEAELAEEYPGSTVNSQIEQCTRCGIHFIVVRLNGEAVLYDPVILGYHRHQTYDRELDEYVYTIEEEVVDAAETRTVGGETYYDCESSRVVKRTCTQCGETLYEVIRPGKHEWNYLSESEMPTCTEPGSAYTRECTICRKYETGDTQPALGHDWDSGVVTVEATCTTEGQKRFTCKREGCGATDLRTTPALGHTAAAPTFSWSGLPATDTIDWDAVENYTVTCTQTVCCSSCGYQMASATEDATPVAVDSTCTETGTVSWVAEFTGDYLSPSCTSNVFTIDLRPGKEARFHVGTSLYTSLYGTNPSNNYQVAIPAISSSEPQYQYDDYTFCGWTTDSSYSSSVDTEPSGYYTNGMNYQFGEEESSKDFYAVYSHTETVESIEQATGSVGSNDKIVITTTQTSGGKMMSFSNQINTPVDMQVSGGKLINVPNECRLQLESNVIKSCTGKYLATNFVVKDSFANSYNWNFGSSQPRIIKAVNFNHYIAYQSGNFKSSSSGISLYIWIVSTVSKTYYDCYPTGIPATAAPAEPAAKRNTQETKPQKQGGTVSLDRMVGKSSGLAQFGDKEAAESLRTEQVQPAQLETGLLHADLSDPKTAVTETLARQLTAPLGNASFHTYQLVAGPTSGKNYLMAVLVGSEYRIVTNKYYYSNYGPQLQAVSVEDGKIVSSDLSNYEFTALSDETGWEFRNKSFYLSLTNDSAHNVALLPQQIPGSDPEQYNDTHWLIETTAGKKYLKNTTTGTNYVYVGTNGNYLSSVFASKKMPIYFFERNSVKYTLTMHYYKEVYDYEINDYVLEKVHDDYVGEYSPGALIELVNPTINGYSPDRPLINDLMPSHDVEMDVIYSRDPIYPQSEVWERVPDGSEIVPDKPYLLVASIYDPGEYFLTDRDDPVYFNGNYAMIMAQSDVAEKLDLPGISTKYYREFAAIRTDWDTMVEYEAQTRGGWTAFPGDFFFDGGFISEAYLNTIDTRYDSKAQVILPEEYLTNCQWTFTEAGDGKYYISSVVDPNYRLSWDYGALFPSTAYYHQRWTYDWEKHTLSSVGADATQYVFVTTAPDGGEIGSPMGSTMNVQSFVTEDKVPDYEQYCSTVYLYQRKSYTEEQWRVYAFDEDGVTVFATPQVANDPDGDGPRTGVTLREALSDVHPYKENWSFVGWTAMNGDAIDLEQEVHSNISVRALYTPNYRSTYAVHVQANYIPDNENGLTHVYWYANNGTTKNHRGGARMEDTALEVDQAVTIPLPYWTDTGYHPLPTPNDPYDEERVFCEDVNFLRETGLTYNGYVFLGWAQVPNNGSDTGADHSDLTSEDLFLEWVNGHYEEVTSGGTSDTVWVPGHYIDPATGNTVTEVAPGDLNADTDFYAVWEPLKYFFVFHSATGTMIAYDWNAATLNGTRPFNLVDHVEDGYLYGGYYSAYAPLSYAEEQYLLYNLYKQVGGGTAATYYQWMMAEEYYDVTEPTSEVLGDEGEKAFFFGATADTYLGRYNYVDYDGNLTTSVYSQVTVDETPTYVRNKKIWDSKYAYKGVDNVGTALRPQPGAVYYIKEVPSYYLTSKIAYTYSTDSNKYCNLQDMWMLSLTDDNNYADVGFQYSSGENMTDLLDSTFISRETFAKTINFKDKEGNVTARFNASSFFPNDGVLQENCGIVFALHREDLAPLLQGGINRDPGSFSMVPAWYTLDTVYVRNNAINWSKRVLGEDEEWGDAEALDQTGLLTGLRGLLTTSRLYVDSTDVDTFAPTEEFPGWIFANRFVTEEPDPEDPGKPVEEPDGSSFLGEGTWWNDDHDNWCLVPEISGFYRYLLLLTPGDDPEDDPTYVKYLIDLHADSLKLANAENVDGVMVGGWDFKPGKQVGEDLGDDPEPEP